jgi:hypothetical protein
MLRKLISGMATLLMVLAPLASSSLAEAAETLPANAVTSRYGSGWDCLSGFQRIADRCARIIVPANAYLDESFGSGWRCDRGFQLSQAAACIPINIPANAFLSRSGRSRECERGFRREESTCIAVRVQRNAHLDYAGDNWKCDRGFHSHNSGCAAD